MFSALLTSAVYGNNYELHVPEKRLLTQVGLVIEWPSVLLLVISRREKTFAFAANRNKIPQSSKL